jgi:hypothetical protein
MEMDIDIRYDDKQVMRALGCLGHATSNLKPAFKR